MTAISIIFDGPPDHHGPRFVEIENDKGESIRIGDWEPDPRPEHEGFWRLRIADTSLRAMGVEIDREIAGAWYVQILDDQVHHTTEGVPVNIDWTRDGRMVGVELLSGEEEN